MSECANNFNATIQGTSLVQSGVDLAEQRAPKFIQPCPNPARRRPVIAARKIADDRLFCGVGCCCLTDPVIGKNGQNLMQGCIEKAFKEADEALGFNSRYKSELSYNMQTDPPTPFLHREERANTTEPSRRWQTRAQQEIENYQKGKGMVRRVDIAIVDDPCKPAEQSNIERIVEFKFIHDARDRDQDDAYKKIAGDAKKYSVFRIGAKPAKDEQGCNCHAKPEPVPIPARQAQQAPSPDEALIAAGQVAGWGAVTVLGGLATAALALFPGEGPLGETAAGAITAAAASRTAAAWKVLNAAF